MKICFSFWGFLEAPEASSVVETPDGMRGERYLIVDEMLRRGHQVFCVQKRREELPYPGVVYTDKIPDVDVAFFEWRWKTWKNSDKNSQETDWNRQCELLDEYSKRGIPCLAHDADCKLLPEDELRWPKLVIGESSLSPVHHHRKRIQMPLCTDWRQYHKPAEYSYNYAYLGNNYERDEQFSKYYAIPAGVLRVSGIQTSVHGNWLNRSPERADPKQILKQWPNISFGARLSYRDGMQMLSKSICTTNISKKSFSDHGFITLRSFESIQCGAPFLIPQEHKFLKSVGLGRYVVNSPEDVVKSVIEIQGMNLATRAEIVQAQKEALCKLADFTPSNKVNIIEAVSKREIT